MIEFDTSVEEDGVLLTGHVTVSGNEMHVRMVSPYARDIVFKSAYLSLVPVPEDEVRACAETRLRLCYHTERRLMVERNSKTADEWDREAQDVRRRLHALNTRLKILRDIMLGNVKSELKQGRVSQREYDGMVKAYRDRTAEEREHLGLLQGDLRRISRFADELREGACKGVAN